MFTGPKIKTQGLILGYDTGLIPNSTLDYRKDTSRFNKGEPTTNILEQSGGESLDTRTDIYGNVTKTDLGNGKYKFENDGTGNTTIRLYCSLGNLTDNHVYGCSVNYEFLDTGVGTSVTLDWCDQNNSSFSVNTYGFENRVFISASRSTYDSTFRFMDISIPVSSSIILFDAQVESGSVSPFTPDVRTVTGSIFDLAKNYDLDVTNVTYKSDGTFEFDGVDDYIEVGDSNGLDLTTDISFEFVVKADSTQSNLYPRLIDKSVYLVHLSQTSPFNIAQNITTTSGLRQVSNGSSFNANEWTHIVTTYDGTVGKIYVNGVLENTNDFGSELPCTTNSGTLKFGGDGTTNRPLAGQLPVAKVYNTVLTAEQVEENFQAYRSRFGI